MENGRVTKRRVSRGVGNTGDTYRKPHANISSVVPACLVNRIQLWIFEVAKEYVVATDAHLSLAFVRKVVHLRNIG